MAKGLRASRIKGNKSKLRARVFGPAVDARTERLSQKIQELASAPKPAKAGATEIDATAGSAKDETVERETTNTAEDTTMDFEITDAATTTLSKSAQKKRRENRIQKRHAKDKKKPKNAMTFAKPRGKK